MSFTLSMPSGSGSSGASGSGGSGGASTSSAGEDASVSVTRLISNFIEALGVPTSGTGPASARHALLDPWPASSSSSPPQNPIGTISREYRRHNNNHLHKDDNSSGSPGTSSSGSVCFRCEERAPTTRCLECNDLYCQECCESLSPDRQVHEHRLQPITHRHISPIGMRSNSFGNDKVITLASCELHLAPIKFFCESCTTMICEDCTQWFHKDHNYALMRGSLDSCRLNMVKAIESGKAGTKAIKGAIDRAVAISKSFERDTAEVTIKIKKAMRCFTQAIEDREKYLIDKVDRMRQLKLNELSEQMNSLRGILAGLAHTNESMVKSLRNNEGIDIFQAKQRGMSEIEYFASMYKSMQPKDENIIFLPPNYDLVDQLKRQCEVLPASAASSMHSLSALHAAQAPPTLQSPPPSYPLSAGVSSMPDYAAFNARVNNYYDLNQGFTSSMSQEAPQRGLGQCIPGYWASVAVKPTRSPVPGVPMLSFGKEGPDEGEVSRPWGLCVDREGNIIVADRRNNRIQVFTSQGEFKSMFGCKGTGPGEFDLPAGITTDTNGRIIVIDKDNHRVQIFSAFGHYLLKFGSFGKECGQFQYPWDVAVNSLGTIVVTDTRNHRVQMFSSEGIYITMFAFEGNNPSKHLKGPTTPRGICYTTSGNILLSDFENHRLIILDPTLSKVVHGAGREGGGIAELNRPSGIVCDDEGRVVVADSKNHRVLVFTADLRYLWTVDLKSPGLDDKDRPSDVALTPEGYLVVLFETLPDTARDIASHGKEYIKIY